MAPPILTLKNIHLTFGSTPLLEGAEMSVQPGARLCLVGRNGSGKSTLLKIAAGMVEPDDGERFIKPGTTVRYLAQDPDLSGFETARDFIEDGQIGTDASSRIPYLLDALGLSGQEDPATMSGGESKRAALARVLAAEPDLLMLDEPTNHLDLPIIEWLEGTLSAYGGALLLISHDRRFLSELTNQTLWVDRGETRLIDQGFGAFEDWRDNFLEQEELERHKLGRKIAREQHWIVHGVSGRRKRNVRRVKELAGLRSQKANEKQVVGKANVSVAEGQTSGKRVAELTNISQTFDNAAGQKTVIDDFSIKIARGDRIGLVGPNGSGKTTLLKIITGALTPDEGKVELGTNLQPLILDQKREGLDPDTTLRDALTGGGGDSVLVNGEQKHVIGYMKDFLFAPEQQRTPLHALSGGERARVELARGLRLPSNLLVLDEPTNDLDLETLDLLQELIADYNGTVLLVSHDRDFLDRTVGTTVNFEGEGKWTVYAGGYSDMQRQRKKTAKAAAKAASEQKPQRSTGGAPKPKALKAKLSYKHKYALETLPGEMKQLESEISALGKELADPKFYASDPAKFKKLADKMESKKSSLEAKELEWLELEILREEAGE